MLKMLELKMGNWLIVVILIGVWYWYYGFDLIVGEEWW